MKTILTINAVVGFLVTLFVQPGLAQTQPSTTPVAVIDIGHIFKNHPRFKQAMENVKKQVEASDEKFRARTKDIESRAKQLKTYKPDSAEYKQLEAETARLQAQIQADMALKRKEFMLKEAEVYYAIYNEVLAEVKAFADNHRVGLVLRFSADKIDPADRNSVLQGVNRPVVYQRNLNITHDILDRLQRRSGSARTAQAPAPRAARGTQPRTRPAQVPGRTTRR